MFANRVVLFGDHCEIYFNISNYKGTQLKISERPNIDNEIKFYNRKEQSKP